MWCEDWSSEDPQVYSKMSLASLAAYASSDESDSEPAESSRSPAPSASSVPVASSVDLIEDDDYPASHNTVTSSLPQAEGSADVVGGNIFQADDVVDDVPLADKIHAEKPKKSQKVKISIPSLSQFKDDDEDEEEPAAKKMKPSSKGSGLFSLLPPPKTTSKKQVGRALLPQTVSRPAPARRAASASAFARAPAPAPEAAPDSDDEGGGDFFSLSEEPASLPPLPAAGPVGPLTFSEREQAAAAEPRPASPVGAGPDPMDTGEQPHATGSQWPAQSQLDAQALQHLRGRRGRRGEADIHFIDVNQDDILPDRDEWMTKQLTEEKVVRRPQKSADDPTTQQRRKHQITYLAHQAKEREVELKNEWALNRATKNAYRTKYGF